MPANETPLGFAQKVRGCGPKPTDHTVTNVDELKEAVDDANRDNGTLIVVDGDIEEPDGLELTLTAERLTIYGNRGSSLAGIGFVIDTTEADDIVFQNLTFNAVGREGKEPNPDDTLIFRTVGGKAKVGYWVDHCTFGPVPDMNVQLYADEPGREALLLSISNCRFVGNPAWEDQGSMDLSAYGKSHDPDDYDVNVTLYACYFLNSRRRSPRSSQGTFVHAFNNVLQNWGAGSDDDQSNGMAVGDHGRLAAFANYFDAGKVKPVFDLSDTDVRLDVGRGLDTNMYVDDARRPPRNDDIDVAARYANRGLTMPQPQPITTELAKAIMDAAGANLPDWPG